MRHLDSIRHLDSTSNPYFGEQRRGPKGKSLTVAIAVSTCAVFFTAAMFVAGSTARAQDTLPQGQASPIHDQALPAQAMQSSAPPQAQPDSNPPPPPADATFARQPAPEASDPPASTVRAVRLSDVEGKVQVYDGTQQDSDQARPNMPVMEGMRLVTGADGRAEVEFEDGSVARVSPNSSITLSQLHRDADGNTVTTIEANSGLSYYELNARAGQYSVHVANYSITPADSSIFRVNLDQNPEFAVTHGTVHLNQGQDTAIDVRTNQTVLFNTPAPGQFDIAQSVNADSWDQWNSDRDQALATLEESATGARAGTGNPDDPAWADLDYYGDWYDVPGYGEAWAPSGVGAGWDPFANGGWGYSSGVGYSWISANPWGWLPYHCGAWDYFNSSGWMWFPGNCGYGSVGAGWHTYPPIWRRPHGYLPPQPPFHGPHRSPLPIGQSFVAVDRPQDTVFQFRSIGQPRPAPRTLTYEGAELHAEQSTIRLRTAGPLGESYTSSVVRSHPELYDTLLRSQVTPGFGNTALRSGHEPASRGYAPPATYSSRPSYTAAPRPAESPHYSAPSAPASHPSGGHPK